MGLQDALKYALILKAPREQSVAFGNLATSAFGAGDDSKVRTVTHSYISPPPPFTRTTTSLQAEQFVEQQVSTLEEIRGVEVGAIRKAQQH